MEESVGCEFCSDGDIFEFVEECPSCSRTLEYDDESYEEEEKSENDVIMDEG